MDVAYANSRILDVYYEPDRINHNAAKDIVTKMENCLRQAETDHQNQIKRTSSKRVPPDKINPQLVSGQSQTPGSPVVIPKVRNRRISEYVKDGMQKAATTSLENTRIRRKAGRTIKKGDEIWETHLIEAYNPDDSIAVSVEFEILSGQMGGVIPIHAPGVRFTDY